MIVAAMHMVLKLVLMRPLMMLEGVLSEFQRGFTGFRSEVLVLVRTSL